MGGITDMAKQLELLSKIKVKAPPKREGKPPVEYGKKVKLTKADRKELKIPDNAARIGYQGERERTIDGVQLYLFYNGTHKWYVSKTDYEKNGFSKNMLS